MAHPDNAFYGHSRVLSEYAGMGSDPPVIWGHVQHGWSEGHGLALRPRLVGWITKLVYSEANRRAAVDAGIAPVVAMGAPFAYLARLEGGRAKEARPRSTIAYPSHGWERDDVHGSHPALAAALAERETGPVTVCLYWREYDQAAVRRVYEGAGFRVICHGYRDDPHFTRRQHDELLNHDRVVANRVATALWHGALLGLEAEAYGPVFSILGPDEAAAWDDFQRSRWPELFDGGLPGGKARELAAEELGDGLVREPGELRELLGWTQPHLRRGPAARLAVHAEHHLRRVVYNARLRLPRSEPLPRF